MVLTQEGGMLLSVLLTSVLAFSHALAPSSSLPTSSLSLANTRCHTCPRAESQTFLALNLTILVETDVAQFYSYSSHGALLVYFVARANFSEPPSQLQLANFKVENGSILEIVAENGCTQFLVKGAVQQKSAWSTVSTEVKLSVSHGATTTCSGKPFPPASASAISRNGPIGSMYVPNMAYTASGPLTTAATNFIRIAFSEPISGLAITQFNISLTAAPDTKQGPSSAQSRKLLQVVAPSRDTGCVPAYKSQIVPAVKNSTQFYNVFITLPECFYGLVDIQFTGKVLNTAGLQSLPIKSVGYNRIATQIPVVTYSAFENLQALIGKSHCI